MAQIDGWDVELHAQRQKGEGGMTYDPKRDLLCPSCGHRRTLHAGDGCIETLPDDTRCPCPVTYMDLSPRNPKPR